MLDERDVGRHVGSPEPSAARRALCLLTGLILLMAACGEDGGPGPVGPVGPVDADEEGVPGSGRITTETREVSGFQRLVFSSEGTVVLTQAETASLEIEADDNLHRFLAAEVSDGALVISTESTTDIAPSRSIVFRVTVVDPARIELAGVGSVTAAELTGEAVAVVLSGTGDITVEQLQADQLTVEHRGAGTIRLAGRADDQQVTASGVGDYDGEELASRTARVEVAGTARATVWVTDQLELLVSDSATASFYGSPAIQQEVSGSGTVNALGDK